MKASKMVIAGLAVILLAAGGMTQADVFNMGGTRNPDGTWTGLASLETVPVGNPGNAADTRYAAPGYGAVGYSYNIGKYEVTAAQYCEFLNAVAAADTYTLYNISMWEEDTGCKIQRSGTSGNYTYSVAADWGNRPVNYVSFWDACRFANWLHNGQPTGTQGANTMERGSYMLDGYSWYGGGTIQRTANATWVISSEDEWYKAAYYKGGGTNAGYWDYPTSSNTAPGLDMADGSGNNANYYTAPYAYPIDCGKYTTVAGDFQNSASPYGTFDQGGNVREWNDSIIYQTSIYAYRGQRGGSFGDYGSYLHAAGRGDGLPAFENNLSGFRVSEVPEPVTLSLLAFGGLVILRRSSLRV